MKIHEIAILLLSVGCSTGVVTGTTVDAGAPPDAAGKPTGESCKLDAECRGHKCLHHWANRDFPRGYCSQGCAHQNDCAGFAGYWGAGSEACVTDGEDTPEVNCVRTCDSQKDCRWDENYDCYPFSIEPWAAGCWPVSIP